MSLFCKNHLDFYRRDDRFRILYFLPAIYNIYIYKYTYINIVTFKKITVSSII